MSELHKKWHELTNSSFALQTLAVVCLFSGVGAVAIYAYRRGMAAAIKEQNGWA